MGRKHNTLDHGDGEDALGGWMCLSYVAAVWPRVEEVDDGTVGNGGGEVGSAAWERPGAGPRGDAVKV